MVERLKGKYSVRCHVLCLEALRILSREKNGLDVLTTDGALKTMVKHAGLSFYAETSGEVVTIQAGHSEGQFHKKLGSFCVFLCLQNDKDAHIFSKRPTYAVSNSLTLWLLKVNLGHTNYKKNI